MAPLQSHSHSTSSLSAIATTASDVSSAGKIVALATAPIASPQPQPLEPLSAIPIANGGFSYVSGHDDVSQAGSHDATAPTRTGNRDSTQGTTAREQSAAVVTVIAGAPGYEQGQDHDRETSAAAKTTQKGRHSQPQATHKAAHHHSRHSKKTTRSPKKIGQVVRADKEKTYDPKAIIDRWNWEWGYEE